MVPAGGHRKQQDEPWPARHRVKLLNAALLVYLCSGGFLLEQWSDSFSLLSSSPACMTSAGGGEASHRKQEEEPARGAPQREGGAGMEELRNSSAKRMWDITNKLNILYEANWTAQVLDELVEFERRLEELKSVGRDKSSSVHVEVEEEEGPKVEASGRKRVNTNLRKALIQSLAILTGVGSARPLGEPRTSAAKLITLLYAALGIPLLICTFACSGAWLASRSLNVFLRVSHYGYALPIHYLCHICGLKWLCYCFWCCCCCYSSKCKLCCCPQTNTNCTSSCCDTSTNTQPLRPRLKLANRSHTATQPQAHRHKPAGKVRFKEEEAGEKAPEAASLNSQASLLLTCLTAVASYLALGARVYSKLEDKSLLDGLLISFQLISCTRFPDSFTATTQAAHTKSTEQLAGNNIDELEPPQWSAIFLWHFVYLFVGLNLISVCVHIVLLCFSSSTTTTTTTQQPQAEEQIKTNGFMGNHKWPETRDQHLEEKLAPTGSPLVVMDAAVSGEGPLGLQRQPAQQHQQSQLDLRELFVAVEESPSELHLGCASQAQQMSDLSFASTDRSTEHTVNSLCLHHQAQYAGHQQDPSSANSFGALYAPTNATARLYTSRQQVSSASKLHYTNSYLVAHQSQQQQRVSLAQAPNQQFHELEEETPFDNAWHTQTMPTSYSSNHLSPAAGQRAPMSNGIQAAFQAQEGALINSCDTLAKAQPGAFRCSTLGPRNECNR